MDTYTYARYAYATVSEVAVSEMVSARRLPAHPTFTLVWRCGLDRRTAGQSERMIAVFPTFLAYSPPHFTISQLRILAGDVSAPPCPMGPRDYSSVALVRVCPKFFRAGCMPNPTISNSQTSARTHRMQWMGGRLGIEWQRVRIGYYILCVCVSYGGKGSRESNRVSLIPGSHWVGLCVGISDALGPFNMKGGCFCLTNLIYRNEVKESEIGTTGWIVGSAGEKKKREISNGEPKDCHRFTGSSWISWIAGVRGSHVNTKDGSVQRARQENVQLSRIPIGSQYAIHFKWGLVACRCVLDAG